MAIRPNQRRVTIIMDNDDYEIVARAAKADRRSVSSYCNNVIMCYIDEGVLNCSKPSKGMYGVPSKKRTYKVSRLPSKGRVGIV